MKTSGWLKNRMLVSAGLFCLALLAIVLLLIIPSLREIELINRQVYDERVRLEKLYVRGQLQKKVRENYAKIRDNVKFLDEIFLHEHQELQYIGALEQAAASDGVTLKIDIGEAKRTPQQLLSTLKFNFEIKGDWPAIMRWLDTVENIPYYTDIKEVAIAVRAGDKNQPAPERAATVNIAAETYWLVE